MNINIYSQLLIALYSFFILETSIQALANVINCHYYGLRTTVKVTYTKIMLI